MRIILLIEILTFGLLLGLIIGFVFSQSDFIDLFSTELHIFTDYTILVNEKIIYSFYDKPPQFITRAILLDGSKVDLISIKNEKNENYQYEVYKEKDRLIIKIIKRQL